MLIGQAPGPREGTFGRPFAWTAGKTMFRWFAESLGVDEETFRARVYIAAVARCFPARRAAAGTGGPTRTRIGAVPDVPRAGGGHPGAGPRAAGRDAGDRAGAGGSRQGAATRSGRDDGAGRLPRARGRHHPAAAPERGVDVAPDGAGQDPAPQALRLVARHPATVRALGG